MSDDLDFLFSSPNVYIGDGLDNGITPIVSEHARMAGHAVGHMTYPGSGIGDEPFNIYELDTDHLKEANRYLLRANKSMHRSWPRQQLSQDNSLRRDMWLVKWAHSVYIVGLFTQDASLLKINTDTAWAAQVYVDRFLYDKEPMSLCNLFMFDQKSEAWWHWNKQWSMISKPAAAEGVYTVLAGDKLTNAGKLAVKDLYPNLSL